MSSAATVPHYGGSAPHPAAAGDPPGGGDAPGAPGHPHRDGTQHGHDAYAQHGHDAYAQHGHAAPHWHGAPHGHPHGGWVAPFPYQAAPPSRGLSGWFLRAYQRAPRWTAPLAVLVCFAGVAGLVVWDDPTATDAYAPSTCLVKLTTGFDCPGCGGTRAFWYLLNGDVAGAARNHMIATFAAPFLVYAYVAWVANAVFGRRVPMLRLSPRSVVLFLTAWGVFSVARNLPWPPFTLFYV